MNETRTETILIVDDKAENLHLLTQMLSDQVFRVRFATSGERALATIHKEQPDLILLDIMMPDIDGYEVCRLLKADEQTRDIPVIFISALNETFDKVKAFSAGGVDYVTKPFQVEEVLARVRTHLSLTAMRKTLHRQNQQLQEQNEDLEAFAHTVAHDLKSPLATLIGFMDLIQMDAQGLDESLNDLLSRSMTSAQRMNSIVNELLLLATIRGEQIEMVPVEMRDVVFQVLDRMAYMMDQYEADVIVPESWPQVLGYAPWLEEVWVNYFSNGLKYGGEPPHLELGATDQGDGMMRFWVQDNGAGLAPEDQARLFTEFIRLDTVRAQGHGLGLSIVRRIVTKLGGQVGVESQPGAGSRFYFTLPIIQEPALNALCEPAS